MTRLESINPTESPVTEKLPEGTLMAQLGTIPNNPNRDYGVSAVQGKAPDGKVYSGQLIQRVYGSGNVRFYLKGEGKSHPLPAGITTAAEAKIYARQQISKGAWTDFAFGDQDAFNEPGRASTASASPPAPGKTSCTPAFDKGVGPVQGRSPNGTVLTGDLIRRDYPSGQVRYYFKGQNDSHKLPPAITTVPEARQYSRQKISSGRWADFDSGDQAAFNSTKPAGSTAVTQAPEPQQFPVKLAVDFGAPEPTLTIGSSVIMDRAEIAAVNKARFRGYLPDAKSPRYIEFSNDAKGGKDLAEINFANASYDENCNPSTKCEIVGFHGFNKYDDRRLVVPKGASPAFMESYKKTAKLYGQDL